jgi:hypothetical protein
MVLALGFRVRSSVGVRSRQWANDKLKEYIVKGFVLDDVRLKSPAKGRDYFDELTRRLQDNRTSERRFYQKITDIYATSVDYDARHALTQTFFATVQNKVHYAIHGQTAAELFASRADSSQTSRTHAADAGVVGAECGIFRQPVVYLLRWGSAMTLGVSRLVFFGFLCMGKVASFPI